jgi:serine phosphatase RsbU (regulator of sigma subunit)/HAMP domain-containing protein
MAQYVERLRVFTLNSIYGIVLVVANLIAIILMMPIYPLIRTDADFEVLERTFAGWVGWSFILTFAIPVALGSLYQRPIENPLMLRDPSPEQKRRLLNAPLLMSLVGVTGWLTAALTLFPAAWINDVALPLDTVIRYALDMLFAGSMVFVITYYVLESINRRYFIPRCFPEGKLSDIQGAIVLSIRARFYIYYFAAGLFPIFLFYNVFLAMEAGTEPQDLVIPATVLTVAVILLGVFVTYLVAKAYESPLSDMESAAEQIRGGDFDVKVPVVSNDEVGHLGEAINDMAVGLKERDVIVAAHERITQELAVAWRIQKELLPDHVPQPPGWQVTATLEPAKQTSGDFYDFIPFSDGRLGFMVADVTDKGVGAALYMALSRTLLRAYAVEHEEQPELAFGAAHRRILADTNTSQFVTVFFGVLDLATGTLTYSNAGHNPPFLLSQNGGGAGGAAGIQELENTGPPIGLRMFDDITWERKAVQLDPGDVLVLYSDGITEAEASEDDFFEEERLIEVVQAKLRPAAAPGPSAEGIQDAIISEVRRFVGAAPQSDDMTLMVLVRC